MVSDWLYYCRHGSPCGLAMSRTFMLKSAARSQICWPRLHGLYCGNSNPKTEQNMFSNAVRDRKALGKPRAVRSLVHPVHPWVAMTWVYSVLLQSLVVNHHVFTSVVPKNMYSACSIPAPSPICCIFSTRRWIDPKWRWEHWSTGRLSNCFAIGDCLDALCIFSHSTCGFSDWRSMQFQVRSICNFRGVGLWRDFETSGSNQKYQGWTTPTLHRLCCGPYSIQKKHSRGTWSASSALMGISHATTSA